jgi:anti-sigma regulatory factor (Ser/Thr protein kinase)
VRGERRDHFSAAVLEELLGQLPQGLFLFDDELRIVSFNSAGRGVRGVPTTQLVGRRLGGFAPGFDCARLEEAAAEALSSGTPVRDLLVHGSPPDEPDLEMVLSVSLFPVRVTGTVRGLAAVEDVTEREHALERLRLLYAAHRSIGSSLDAELTADELAEAVVPRFADVVTVDILDQALRGEHLEPGPVDAEVPLRRAAFRSNTLLPARPEALITLPFPSPFTQSLGDARPRLVRHLSEDEPWLRTDRDFAGRLIDAGVHTMIVTPLVIHGTVLGVASYYRTQRVAPFDDDDLALADELAVRTSLSIDRARSYAREHHTATVLQRHLLPDAPPQASAVEAAHLSVSGTAGSGGTWYDVIHLSGAQVALTVGAVSGSGIEAAATMGQIRTALRTLAARDLPPEDLLACLDDVAVILAAQQSTPHEDSASASCLYAVYDPLTRLCTAAGAGDPPPLVVVGPDGVAIDFDVPLGAALGTGRGVFESVSAELPEGSLLALCAGPQAGVTADAGHDGPVPRLERVLSDPDLGLRELCDAALYTLRPQHTAVTATDMMILLARTRALREDRVARWTLPVDPAVVATSRRLVEHQLTTWGLSELAFETELIISELVTNAIRYGSAPIHLRLIYDRSLICEVSDGTSTAPHVRRAGPGDEGGRGLYLVGQLGERWGTRFGPHGKTIWCELALPEQEPAAAR